MVVGALGEIVFEVSARKIQTPKNLNWSGSARWGVHERHNNNALTEFTGRDPDKISLEIYLSKHLGTDPMVELVKLWDYERGGVPVSLVLGEKIYGKYRWVVQSHETALETFDHKGNLSACTVKVELLEYLAN